MTIAGLLHFLSLTSLIAYGLASWGYARALAGRTFSRPDLHRRLLGLGLLAHAGFLLMVNRSSASLAGSVKDVGRFPFALSLMSLGLVSVYLVLDRRHQIALLGVFIAPVALLFMLLSAMAFHLHVSPAELFPENSLLISHLFLTACAYVLLLCSGGVAAVLLVAERALKAKRPLSIEKPYPSLIGLDRIQRGMLKVGFFLLSAGIFEAAVYTSVSGKSFADAWDRLVWVIPVIVFSLVAVVASVFVGVRSRRLAFLLVWNAVAVLLSLFGSGVWSGSFHLR